VTVLAVLEQSEASCMMGRGMQTYEENCRVEDS